MTKSLVTHEGHQINTTAGKILVRMDKLETVTSSGIIIPSTVNKRTDFTGVVVAVSRTHENNGFVNVGDRVICSKNTKRIAPTDDKENEYRFYNEEEILLCTNLTN